MLKILTAPNPILSVIAKPVPKVDASIIKVIEEMKEILVKTTDPKGVGLAAPQVGKSLRIFIAKPTDKSKILVFINPEIMQRSSEVSYAKLPALRLGLRSRFGEGGSLACRPQPWRRLGEGGPKKDEDEKASRKLEGCLSLPTIWGPVLRAQSLTLRYQLITNNHELITKTGTFSGFMTTIVQHEMDHLDGILFPKRVLEQKGILYKSHKNEKNEDEFEEIEI